MAQRAADARDEDELQRWLLDDPGVAITSHGGWAPEQWRGEVDGQHFYFRERHDPVRSIRDHLRRLDCVVHRVALADLELLIGQVRRCPACGARLDSSSA